MTTKQWRSLSMFFKAIKADKLSLLSVLSNIYNYNVLIFLN